MKMNKEEIKEALLSLTMGTTALALAYAFLWFSTIFE